MERKNRRVLCDFKDLKSEIKDYFVECLENDNLTVYSTLVETGNEVDMVCTFSCLDNFLRNINNEKNIYVPKPPTEEICLETIFCDNEYLWCTAYGIYAYSLIRINKRSLDVEMFPMPYNSSKKDRLFSKILKVNERLYLIPENSDFIAIYDINKDKWEKIDIVEENPDGWYYSDAIEVCRVIYLMPNKASSVVKINCDNNEIEYISLSSFDSLVSLEMVDKRYAFCACGALIDVESTIYLYSKLYNCFMKYDTTNDNLVVIRKLDKLDFSHSCVSFNGCFWMFTMSGYNRIIKYEINNDELIHYDILPQMAYNRVPFHKGTIIGGKIIFVPGLAEKAIEMDVSSQDISILQNLDIETYDGAAERWIYSDVDSDDIYLYLFETGLKKFVRYDIKKKESEKIKLHLNEKAWYRGQAKKIQQIVLDGINPPHMDDLLIQEY